MRGHLSNQYVQDKELEFVLNETTNQDSHSRILSSRQILLDDTSNKIFSELNVPTPEIGGIFTFLSHVAKLFTFPRILGLTSDLRPTSGLPETQLSHLMFDSGDASLKMILGRGSHTVS